MEILKVRQIFALVGEGFQKALLFKSTTEIGINTGSAEEPISNLSELNLTIGISDSISDWEEMWRVFESTAIGHVFQTFDFVSTWCTHVAPARTIQPQIVTGHDSDGRLMFLLPFGTRKTMGVQIVEWLGGEQADYHGGLFDANYLQQLSQDKAAFEDFIQSIVAKIDGVDLLHFAQMPAELKGFQSPFQNMPTQANANGAHETRLEPDWQAYYKSKRKSGWRRTDRVKERKLSEQGEISFVIANDRETAVQILETLFSQKRDGLARIGVDDMFEQDGVREFYRELALNSIDGPGPVQLSALFCGDRIAAASYGLLSDDTYYYILHSYDLDDLATYSPGRQLMYKLMQWCFDNAVTTFDFTIGDEPYKDAWCEIPTRLCNSEIPLTKVGVAAAGVFRLRESAKQQIKNDPALWSAAVNIRKTIMTLRNGIGKSQAGGTTISPKAA